MTVFGLNFFETMASMFKNSLPYDIVFVINWSLDGAQELHAYLHVQSE
jgi:hypothetical protein